MKTISKEYSYSDIIMLLAAKTSACNFRDNISELSKHNSKWNAAYAHELIARINKALNNDLGLSVYKEQRNATSELKNVMAEVKKDLASFKIMIKTLYVAEPDQKEELLNILGFKQFGKGCYARTQSGLINLIYAFKTNLSASIRQDLTDKGVKDSFIDKIIANAARLEHSNNTQKVLKGNVGEIFYRRKVLYNSIYREVIGICLNAASFYKDLPAKKALFSFNKNAGVVSKRTITEIQED